MGVSFSSGGYISSSSQIADNVIVAADILDDSITLAKLTPTGTATHVLTSNGEGANPEYKVIPSGTGANFEFLETVTLGSAETKLESTFSVTSGTYGGFLLTYNLQCTGDVAGMGVEINGDHTADYYKGTRYSLAATTLSVSTVSYGVADCKGISNGVANNTLSGQFQVDDFAGLSKNYSNMGTLMNNTPSIRSTQINQGVYRSTAEITSLDFVSSSGTYKAGSTMSIWGRKIV